MSAGPLFFPTRGVAPALVLPEDPVLLARLRLLVLEPHRLSLTCTARALAAIHPRLPALAQRLQEFSQAPGGGLLQRLCGVPALEVRLHDSLPSASLRFLTLETDRLQQALEQKLVFNCEHLQKLSQTLEGKLARLQREWEGELLVEEAWSLLEEVAASPERAERWMAMECRAEGGR